ncbi:MAG: hypothetical protein JSV91_04530 [Phycisphaerales bacterium]|nr:MAG: hypothetical protein JSV91_04530 [Phycisphaerales bacterium]
MRVDAASSAATEWVSRCQRSVSDKAEKTNHQAEPTPRGHAYGVVRKLGTDHYQATAQARLMSHFGHLIETPPTSPPPPPDVDANGDAGVVDEPVDNPFSTPPSEPSEPVSESAITEYARMLEQAVDLWA